MTEFLRGAVIALNFYGLLALAGPLLKQSNSPGRLFAGATLMIAAYAMDRAIFGRPGGQS